MEVFVGRRGEVNATRERCTGWTEEDYHRGYPIWREEKQDDEVVDTVVENNILVCLRG